MGHRKGNSRRHEIDGELSSQAPKYTSETRNPNLGTAGMLPPNIQEAVSVLTYDASEFGAGYAIRESPEEVITCFGARYSEISTVSTFTEPLTAQIHRETMAGLMGLEILRKQRSIVGRIVIFRNDCQSGLYGFHKGSNSFQQCQPSQNR